MSRWALLMALAACAAPREFEWETAAGIVCDDDLPDGGVALSRLECNQPADWSCEQTNSNPDGGTWYPCWRVGPADSRYGGSNSLLDGPWVLQHGCCCDPDCGSGVRFDWPPQPLTCDVRGEAPPLPMQCIDGGVVWPTE